MSTFERSLLMKEIRETSALLEAVYERLSALIARSVAREKANG